jgi:hypothetical protein
MFVARRTLGQVDGGTDSSMSAVDWTFALGLFLFGGWLLTAHWKR